MATMTLVFGIILGIGVVLLVVVIGILLARRSRASDKVSTRVVPPPVDPGPTEPEQAKDVNAEKKAAKDAAKDAAKRDAAA
jgi:Na+-transporting methylmalonyl-CoA/oxaloacetate decarboxylase gamma subunit